MSPAIIDERNNAYDSEQKNPALKAQKAAAVYEMLHDD